MRFLTGGPHLRGAKSGLDDEGLLELMAVVDLFRRPQKLMDGLRVEPDEKTWHG